ncbi:MAG TPA: PilZ domain-containing protein [Terriglobales bacterium]|nr:PilZ domain-containing protein [Terriglobales bacterium]
MNLESLLISRDAALMGVLQPTLEKISVSVEACPECKGGFDLLGKRKFDAVIIDCDDLPGGADLLTNMRKASSNAKSVAFAVLNGKTTTQEAFQRGANFVLQKPVTPLHASRCFNAALNFMVRERRRYFRYPVEIPLQVKVLGQDIKATSTNLSEGGMSLRIPAKVPKDTPVALRFTLPATNTTLELKGEVAWVDGTRQAGVRFVEVPQSSQYQLDKWLTDRLREEVPHNLAVHT